MFITWSYSSGTGNILVLSEDVSVVYSAVNPDGTGTNVVAREDPHLAQVVAVEVQDEVPTAATLSRANWSGYELAKSGTFQTVQVYEATAVWNVPGVSEPWSYACFYTHCDLAIWPGLVNNAGGSNGIAQGGSNSGVYCTFGCSKYYWLWYQFWPNNLVKCNVPVSPGDQISADIVRTAIYSGGGGDQTTYNIYVNNNSKNKGCGTTNFSFTQMGTPFFAEFIGERLQYGNSYARLPRFSSFTMQSCNIDQSWATFYRPCYTSYSNGWYNLYLMTNGGNQNIDVGPVNWGGCNSCNSFTMTWRTSSGT